MTYDGENVLFLNGAFQDTDPSSIHRGVRVCSDVLKSKYGLTAINMRIAKMLNDIGYTFYHAPVGLGLIGMAGVLGCKKLIQNQQNKTGGVVECPRQRSATPLFLVQFQTPPPFNKKVESIGSAFFISDN